jgi:hypothetical protein
VFITYDLDADSDVSSALARLGLKQKDDYLALGVNQAGKDCIEGLLPQCVLSAMNGRETDLVMQLSSRERKTAKEALKKLYLKEFGGRSEWSKDDLKDLGKIATAINRRFERR